MLTKASSQQHSSGSSMSPDDINSPLQINTSNTTTTNRHDQQSQHEALTNLVRSLTNLASTTTNNDDNNNNNNNNNMINAINSPFDRPLDISFSPHLNSTPVAQNLSTSASNHDPIALANSLESVVAAAVMQQISQHQQIPPLSLPQQQAKINPNRLMGQQHQLPSFMSPDILQSGLAYPFMNEQPAPLLIGGASNHQDQFSNYNNNSNSQQNQRINYCTICNKELCNKYFMKTHMLKMHGINLEMEQSANDTNQNRADETKDDCLNNDADPCGSSLKATDLSKNHQQTKCSRQSSECKPSAGTNPQTASSRNNVKLSTSAAGSSKQTATSVMNGFAGNSMGGVVCDICNKELCSKYFLKVHKQNTHGIMTDYQDASQFVYPFVNPMAPSNPFMPQSLTMNPLATPTSNILPFPASFSHNNSSQMAQASNVYVESQSNTSKRSRPITDDGKQPKRDPNSSRTKSNSSHTNEPPAADYNGLNSFYRLMLEQQKHPTLNGQMQSHLPTQSVISQTFDPLAANQMSSLMCFGAMGPFGPTGITPTMIVEIILRNQHLFSRNNKNTQLINQNQSLDKDKNNNESKQKPLSKNSKESNNSRYFTHYTEACPMCDRRFKSIKWLKTHMMNDHKQEIGTYMQMMMQNLYMNKGMQQLSSAPQFDQGSCYPSMNSSSCNQIIQQPKYQHPISMCNNQPPANVAQQTLQGEQINLIQSYLNQQRHQVIMQQHPQEMLDLSPEPSRKQIKISSSPPAGQNKLHVKSLSSLSAKVSPTRSLVGDTEDQDYGDRQDDQLSLSTQCNRDLRDCELDIGMNYNSENCRVKVPSEINQFSESDSSTRSSFRNEETTSASNSDSAEKRKQVVSSSL